MSQYQHVEKHRGNVNFKGKFTGSTKPAVKIAAMSNLNFNETQLTNSGMIVTCN
jgi:hypothetical protein